MKNSGEVLRYVECKGQSGDRGKAWIGYATVSRSGRTVYFNGMALQRIPRGGVSGNHRNLETGEEYWISGVKKRGTNRHWAGGGVVFVERRALDEFRELTGRTTLGPDFAVTDEVVLTDIARFEALLNTSAQAEEQPPVNS